MSPIGCISQMSPIGCMGTRAKFGLELREGHSNRSSRVRPHAPARKRTHTHAGARGCAGAARIARDARTARTRAYAAHGHSFLAARCVGQVVHPHSRTADGWICSACVQDEGSSLCGMDWQRTVALRAGQGADLFPLRVVHRWIGVVVWYNTLLVHYKHRTFNTFVSVFSR